MDIFKFIKNSWYLILIIFVLLITNSLTFCYFYFNKNEEPIESCEPIKIVQTEENNELEEQVLNVTKIKVDIKGYINNPGVYELEDGAIVNDLINLAGGIKKDGTTENINLSKKLKDEMVVVIYSKNELNQNIKENVETKGDSSLNITDFLKKFTSVIDQNEQNNESQSPKMEDKAKINLNTATKEELMTISGIGEAKALSIIEYREKTPFISIEDLKNISGIGDKLFEQIKDYITV